MRDAYNQLFTLIQQQLPTVGPLEQQWLLFAILSFASMLPAILVAYLRRHPRRCLILLLSIPASLLLIVGVVMIWRWALCAIPIEVEFDGYAFKIRNGLELRCLCEENPAIREKLWAAYYSSIQNPTLVESLSDSARAGEANWADFRIRELMKLAKRLRTRILSEANVLQSFQTAGEVDAWLVMTHKPVTHLAGHHGRVFMSLVAVPAGISLTCFSAILVMYALDIPDGLSIYLCFLAGCCFAVFTFGGFIGWAISLPAKRHYKSRIPKRRTEPPPA